MVVARALAAELDDDPVVPGEHLLHRGAAPLEALVDVDLGLLVLDLDQEPTPRGGGELLPLLLEQRRRVGPVRAARDRGVGEAAHDLLERVMRRGRIPEPLLREPEDDQRAQKAIAELRVTEERARRIVRGIDQRHEHRDGVLELARGPGLRAALHLIEEPDRQIALGPRGARDACLEALPDLGPAREPALGERAQERRHDPRGILGPRTAVRLERDAVAGCRGHSARMDDDQDPDEAHQTHTT